MRSACTSLLMALAACAAPAEPASAVQARAEARAEARTVPLEGPVAHGRAEFGQVVPRFRLPDLEGRYHDLADLAGRIVVLEWTDPECVEVVWAYEHGSLREQARRYAALGVTWLTIHSTRALQDGGARARMADFVFTHDVVSPVLIDAGAEVARAYGIERAPTCCVLNERGVLVYRGALDNSPLGKVWNNGPRFNLVDEALEDLRSGHSVRMPKTKPYGCPIR